VKIYIIKLIVFVGLLACFYFFGGFQRPIVSQDDYRSPRRMAKAWLVTVIMFVAGAALTVYGNDIAQMVDWDIPNGLYPAIGVMLLIGGFVWMLMVRDSVHLARAPNKLLEPSVSARPIGLARLPFRAAGSSRCGLALIY
jgi:hypothetical protein